MKSIYKRLSILPLPYEAESEILTESIVEVESDVTVEEFKDGFDSVGSNGFEVDFN